jgi:hypothetical protein
MKSVTDVAAFFWNNPNLTGFTLESYSDGPFQGLFLPKLPTNLEFICILHAPNLLYLPELPGTLKILEVQFTGLKELEIPGNLQRLVLGRVPLLKKINNLAKLNSLELWDIPNLAELIPVLPAELETLALFNCPAWLPRLPDSLRSIRISNSHIGELPVLPESLEDLTIDKCPNLKSLPKLPASLKKLNIPGRTTSFWLGETFIQF